MKYAIKGDQYVSNVDERYYFSFAYDIDAAKQFNSINDIITLFARRARHSPAFTTAYTIVGIKEVSNPRYEEVLL